MRRLCLVSVFAISITTLGYAQAPIVGTCGVFPADNIWNTPVDSLPVAPISSTYVNTIGATAPAHADFGSGTWNGGPIGIPFVKAPGTQTKYPATFLYSSESDAGPYAIPLNAPIEGGSSSTGDRHAISVDIDNCILYELYNAYPQTASWKADSGAIFDLKSNALRPATWTSADAAGLPIMPGLVRYDEVAAGEIRHAIRFTVPTTQRAYVWPARHYASSQTSTSYPPMGARFRLKASFDITPFPADVQVILRALKKYGMMLADNGSAWFISGEPDSRWNDTNLSTVRNITGAAFEAVDVSPLMIDPNSGQARQAGVSVSVTPSPVTLLTQGTQQFTATVQNQADQTVSWGVNGVSGGSAAAGYISASGFYTAPVTVPSPATVSVQATTATAVTGSAAVTVTYPAPVTSSVAPNPIVAGAFSLTVSGSGFLSGGIVKLGAAALTTTFVSAVQVTANGSTSTISASVPVTVVNPDGQISNAYAIAVNPSGPVSVSVSPPSASVKVRTTRQFTAAVQNAVNTGVIWNVNGVVGGNSTVGRISTAGLYSAPSSVPSPSVVTVSAVSVADSTKSGSAGVTVTRK